VPFVTEILWGPYQEHHIAVRHGLTAEQFEEAWIDRVDLVIRHDDSYESLGATDDGREVYLVWRWDISDPSRVFPITAFFLQQQEPD
jgi:protein-tyrosine-phosphatase